jgi:hypothetical protein
MLGCHPREMLRGLKAEADVGASDNNSVLGEVDALDRRELCPLRADKPEECELAHGRDRWGGRMGMK